MALGGKEDFFAYSCLTPEPGGGLAVLYEESCLAYMGKPRGAGYSRAVFRRLSRREVEG